MENTDKNDAPFGGVQKATSFEEISKERTAEIEQHIKNSIKMGQPEPQRTDFTPEIPGFQITIHRKPFDGDEVFYREEVIGDAQSNVVEYTPTPEELAERRAFNEKHKNDVQFFAVILNSVHEPNVGWKYTGSLQHYAMVSAWFDPNDIVAVTNTTLTFMRCIGQVLENYAKGKI